MHFQVTIDENLEDHQLRDKDIFLSVTPQTTQTFRTELLMQK